MRFALECFFVCFEEQNILFAIIYNLLIILTNMLFHNKNV